MIFLRLAAPLMVLWFTQGAAVAADKSWADLRSWGGRYPTDDSAGPARKLFDVPAVRAALTRILDGDDLRRLAAYAVETPVQLRESFLIAHICMPHDCGAHKATVLIDTAGAQLWVDFISWSDKGLMSCWFGPSDPMDLPATVLAAVAAQDAH